MARSAWVGVDVEVLRPVPAAGLARYWFTAAEAIWVAERPEAERSAAFLWLWTQKEAVGKALGIGLRDGGTRRAVLPCGSWEEPAGDGRRLVALPGTPELSVAVPAAAPGVSLAVAVRGARAAGTVVDMRDLAGLMR